MGVLLKLNNGDGWSNVVTYQASGTSSCRALSKQQYGSIADNIHHSSEKLRTATVCTVRTWLVPRSRSALHPSVFPVGQSLSRTGSSAHVAIKAQVEVDGRAVVRHANINAQGVRHNSQTHTNGILFYHSNDPVKWAR